MALALSHPVGLGGCFASAELARAWQWSLLSHHLHLVPNLRVCYLPPCPYTPSRPQGHFLSIQWLNVATDSWCWRHVSLLKWQNRDYSVIAFFHFLFVGRLMFCSSWTSFVLVYTPAIDRGLRQACALPSRHEVYSTQERVSPVPIYGASCASRWNRQRASPTAQHSTICNKTATKQTAVWSEWEAFLLDMSLNSLPLRDPKPRQVITVLTKARHCTRSQANFKRSQSSFLICAGAVLILSSRLRLGLLSGCCLLPRSSDQNFTCASHLPEGCCIFAALKVSDLMTLIISGYEGKVKNAVRVTSSPSTRLHGTVLCTRRNFTSWNETVCIKVNGLQADETMYRIFPQPVAFVNSRMFLPFYFNYERHNSRSIPVQLAHVCARKQMKMAQK
jgi:hypothetical protein